MQMYILLNWLTINSNKVQKITFHTTNGSESKMYLPYKDKTENTQNTKHHPKNSVAMLAFFISLQTSYSKLL